MRSAYPHFPWQREQSAPAAPLASLKFCLVNLNYRWHNGGMEMDCTYRDKPIEKPCTCKGRREEGGSDMPQIFQLLWYSASPTQHFAKQFVSFFFFLFISPHLHWTRWTFLWSSQRVLGCKYNKKLANAWESKLAMLSVVSAFKYYCSVIISWHKKITWKQPCQKFNVWLKAQTEYP